MQCRFVLKEWSAIETALRLARQCLLLRRGGLADGRSGFVIESEHFLIYPTYEHQHSQWVQPAYAGWVKPPAGGGRVSLSLYGVVSERFVLKQREQLMALLPWTIYNEAFVDQRLQWLPDNPTQAFVVRAYPLVKPILLPVSNRYRGCRSWYTVEEPASVELGPACMEEAVFVQTIAGIRRAIEAA
jgi:hypothetical protein